MIQIFNGHLKHMIKCISGNIGETLGGCNYETVQNSALSNSCNIQTPSYHIIFKCKFHKITSYQL